MGRGRISGLSVKGAGYWGFAGRGDAGRLRGLSVPQSPRRRVVYRRDATSAKRQPALRLQNGRSRWHTGGLALRKVRLRRGTAVANPSHRPRKPHQQVKSNRSSRLVHAPRSPANTGETRENAAARGTSVRGISWMLGGLWDAEGPQRRAERAAEGPHRCPRMRIRRVRMRPELRRTAIQGDRTLCSSAAGAKRTARRLSD